MRADAVPARDRLDRAADGREEPEVMMCVQVIDRDAGGADARHLRVELALDVAGVDLPLASRRR